MKSNKAMRVVVADYSGHPFQIELSRCLASRGHDVLHLHFSEFQTPKGSMAPQPSDAESFHVVGVSLGAPFAKQKFLRRRFQEAKIGTLFAARAMEFRPDIVIGCNMPLDAQLKLQRACATSGIGFIFWLQDIYSSAISHYLGARFGLLGQVVGLYYQNLEGRLLRASNAVVAISDYFTETLLRWKVSQAQINLIPNWAPLSEIHPQAKDSSWSRRHGLTDKKVALYTGTLGLKHDPLLLLDLARAGQAQGLQVTVASEGPAANWLADQAAALGVDNLLVLPFQPMELYSQLLGAGDIMLAMVGAEAAEFSVPSKIFSYLAAGKPIVAAIKDSNDAARMICEAGAGSITAPGDTNAFIAQVLKLAAFPELCDRLGANGRAFAEKHFAIEPIADRFEALLSQVLAETLQ